MRKLQITASLLFIAILSFAQKTEDHRALWQLIRTNISPLQLGEDDVNQALISDAYTDPGTGITYVYLQQGLAGLPVFNSIKTIAFRNNELLYHSGNFIGAVAGKAGKSKPSLSASAALLHAAQHLKLSNPSGLRIIEEKENGRIIKFNDAGIAKEWMEARLFWVVLPDHDSVRLAWNINIDVKGSPDWWNVRVDAENGNILDKDNWTVNENGHLGEHKKQERDYDFRFYAPPPPTVTNGGYYVVPYPIESPKHGALATENQPWMKAGTGNPAITNGWHFDGTNNYQFTRGNNVFAYLDLQGNNTPGGTLNHPDTSSTPIPSLSFSNVPNFTLQPSVSGNRKAAVTNLFYWNNIIHDITYQYGFNELSGNFQTDNMGRGGNGNDYVQAEAQDAAGTNNANFATPSDGLRPRMQMFLFTGGPSVVVTAPSSIAGQYGAVESAFSNNNKLAFTGPVTGQVIYYNDSTGGTHEACTTGPAVALTGKIALIDRGNCNFTDKVKRAQNAGAIGVIMINNVAGAPIAMGGSDNSITIPALMITQSAGSTIASQLSNGVTATLALPVGLDGDYDNGIVVHEYGHGISNRLTGGPSNASCLSNAEQGGEGWSDYFTLMLTTDWSAAQLTDGPKPRPMGTYALNQPVTGSGIRTFPYSTNMSVNPLTYSNMAQNTEVHFTGEIWCAALWDMTWNIIQQTATIEPNLYNSNAMAGNTIAMKLVMEGMRLQPCQPGFLDARNAILAADSILYNGAYKCAIWKAFARRGMGFSAVQGRSTSASDQIAAFDVPSAIFLSKSSAPSVITPGSQHTVNLSVNCQCQVPTNSFVLQDTIPAGFSYVNSTGGVLNGNVVSFSSINFTQEQEVKNFALTIKAENNGCFIDTAINDNRTSTIGGLTSSFTAGNTNWISSALRSKSPANSWLASTPTASSDFTLTSSQFTVGNLSVLSFWHYYVTEHAFDGGTVELSSNNGSTWFDASPFILQNGYNTKMDGSAPFNFPNSRAYSGVSYGQGNGGFIHTVMNLSSFNGQNLRMRFRMRTDTGNPFAAEGWFIDDILLLNGCGGIVKAALFNSNNVKIDSAAYPVYIKSNGVPTTIQSHPAATTACVGTDASFSIAASGGTLTYQWQVSTNGGATYTDISGATGSTLTIPNVSNTMNGNFYRCIVDNGSNSATSSPAMLTIGTTTTAGVISNVTACEGGNAMFSSNASGNNLSYQWQVSSDGGNQYNNIAGGTGSNLNLNNLILSQNGNMYRVVVEGTCGTASSTSGTLTVNAAPAVSINNPPANLCTTDDAVTLSASQAGGTWSGQGMNGALFNPAGLNAGIYQVNYSITNLQGCTGMASASITVINCADRQLPLWAPGVIILYPNPNDGRFTIEFRTERYSNLSMRVYAADGKLVNESAINGISYGFKKEVNLNYLASDVYLLSLYDQVSGDEKTFKLIIAR